MEWRLEDDKAPMDRCEDSKSRVKIRVNSAKTEYVKMWIYLKYLCESVPQTAIFFSRTFAATKNPKSKNIFRINFFYIKLWKLLINNCFFFFVSNATSD